MMGLGLPNFSFIFGGLKPGSTSNSPSDSNRKSAKPLALDPAVASGLAEDKWMASSFAATVRLAVRALFLVPCTGLGLECVGLGAVGLEVDFWVEVCFIGVGFLTGVSLGAEGFFGGVDFWARFVGFVGVGVGVVGLRLPFVDGCLLIEVARAREVDCRDALAGTGAGVDSTSFLCCSDCLRENLVGRVLSPLLLTGGGSNSRGIGFVLPDFRRPDPSRKDVGVCVVALFHGGESSSLRFLEGGFLISELSPSSRPKLGEEALGSGVVACPFSIAVRLLSELDELDSNNFWGSGRPGEPDSPGRFRVLLRIHEIGWVGGWKLKIELDG